MWDKIKKLFKNEPESVEIHFTEDKVAMDQIAMLKEKIEDLNETIKNLKLVISRGEKERIALSKANNELTIQNKNLSKAIGEYELNNPDKLVPPLDNKLDNNKWVSYNNLSKQEPIRAAKPKKNRKPNRKYSYPKKETNDNSVTDTSFSKTNPKKLVTRNIVTYHRDPFTVNHSGSISKKDIPKAYSGNKVVLKDGKVIKDEEKRGINDE